VDASKKERQIPFTLENALREEGVGKMCKCSGAQITVVGKRKTKRSS